MMTAAEFRALHRPGEPLVLPNAWDLASARWLHAAGHPVVGTTSLGVAVASGRADGAGEIADQTRELAAHLTAAGIAVTVDLESGFSDDPDDVGRFAAELAHLGVVGVNIEDSAPDGRLVDPETAAAKIAAIAAAAPELYLNARTDTFWIGGDWIGADADASSRLGDAVHRAHRYLEAGASGIFVPGTLAPAVIAQLTRAIPAPLNVLVQSRLPVNELARLGVARVSTGSLLFRIALGAISNAAASIRDGTFDPPSSTPDYETVAALPDLR
jgi:2-methylisocitrate lyase-like PEP mutase family enzyme